MNIISVTTMKQPQEMIPAPTDVGALANRINFATRQKHNKIDKEMTLKFALALKNAKIYRQGLQGFYHIFKNVEVIIEREIASQTRVGQILSQFWDPTFARTKRLETDLLFFYGDYSKFEKPVLEQQQAFVQHLYSSCHEKPHLILAYCHVMYLALFAGGRIMRSSLTRATGLFPSVDGFTTAEVAEQATNFFKFDTQDEHSLRWSYKKAYELATRDILTELEKTEIINESLEIFDWNGKIVGEIEQHNRDIIQASLVYKLYTLRYVILLAVVLLCIGYVRF